MKETRLINSFSEKNSHLGKWAILGSKITHPHNSGSAGRIFLTFCTMKGVDINTFPKKILFGANEPFWAQKWGILITLDLL